jgi:hypothetical protein
MPYDVVVCGVSPKVELGVSRREIRSPIELSASNEFYEHPLKHAISFCDLFC